MDAMNTLEKTPYSKYLIVGFNALNKAEDILFSFFKKTGKAVFLWKKEITSIITCIALMMKILTRCLRKFNH